MAVQPGTMLSHYRIVEKVGEGGMGLVYRALDTKLNRQVAVKILPDAFARDPERLARFEREAKMLASLNHPNVAAIHGLDRDGEVRFLVLELVPGMTLAERLPSGRLTPPEALSVARQIAEGLEAAHDRGIIHRDLKPANIKITPDGVVKVLDFGLAKEVEGERRAADPVSSPTITSDHTRADVILGTAAYMSPEQARGKPLDKRTDIWSFGCVLYEALSGRQAFPGETVSDCLARILEREPDWKQLSGVAPERVVDLLRRCLQKDSRKRLRDIGDARIEIEEMLAAPPGAARSALSRPATFPGWRGALRLGVLILAIALIGGVAGQWLLPLTRSGKAGGPGPSLVEVARLTHDPGLFEWPTWSPDGNLLAFSSNRSGNFEIYVRRVEGGQEVNVTNDPGQDFQPTFSPDGNSIAFVSTRTSRTGMIKIGAPWGLEFRTYGGDLWTVPVLGGQARRLGQDANSPAWHPDGRRIAYVSGPESHRTIMEVGIDGDNPKTLLASDKSSWEIIRLQYAPPGDFVSFESVDSGLVLVPRSGGAPRVLIDAASHVWDRTGRRLYYLGRDPLGGTRLKSVDVDVASARVLGTPRTLGLMTGILRDLALSRDEHRLAVSESEWSLNLTVLPLKPGGGAPAGAEEIVSDGQVIDRYPTISPDGRQIAFASDRLGPMEIWIADLATGQRRRLQLPGTDSGTSQASWSPDGSQIMVTRYQSGFLRSVWLAAADGSHAEEVIPAMPSLIGWNFSPDGRRFLFSTKQGETLQLFTFDIAARRQSQVTKTPYDKYEGVWSADGRWVMYISSLEGASQIWRVPAAGGQEERLTSSPERFRHLYSSTDGRWLYVQLSHRNIYRMPASGGSLQPVTSFPESGLFLEEPTLSRDGRLLAYCRSNGGSSLWLMTIAQDSAEGR